jgi:hypothetical protein
VEIEAELQIADLGAAVVLARRSHNSSQASSARSHNPSEASSRRWRRRCASGKERSLRGSLGEVLEGPEDQAIVAIDDSRATTPYYSAQGSNLDEVSAALTSPPTGRSTCNEAQPANPGDNERKRATCENHVRVGCAKGSQCPCLHPGNTTMMNGRLVTHVSTHSWSPADNTGFA